MANQPSNQDKSFQKQQVENLPANVKIEALQLGVKLSGAGVKHDLTYDL